MRRSPTLLPLAIAFPLALAACSSSPSPEPTAGLNTDRYDRQVQLDYLYNGSGWGFGEPEDVWLVGGYRKDSCDVSHAVRRGCVLDYVIVDVGPLGAAAGRAVGDLWGELIWDETPRAFPGYAPDERVLFAVHVTSDNTGSYPPGTEATYAQAVVDDESGQATLVAEWEADGDTAHDDGGDDPVPAFREWGGTAYRERFCDAAEAVFPEDRCAPTCTLGGVHPDYPTCEAYAEAHPRP